MIIIYSFRDFYNDYRNCYDEFADDFAFEQELNCPYKCRSWSSSYSNEVDRITEHYEKLNAENAKTNTIVSIATPEEMKMYEERRNKTDCHRLTLKK